MTFSKRVAQFVFETKLKRRDIVRKLALDAYTGLLFRSPVDSGRFRASWRISIGEPDLSVEADRRKLTQTKQGKSKGGRQFANPAGGDELRKLNAALRLIDGKSAVFFTNNLPYAKRLEDGYSGQTGEGKGANTGKPDGILGDTFKTLSAQLEQNIQQIRQRAA